MGLLTQWQPAPPRRGNRHGRVRRAQRRQAAKYDQQDNEQYAQQAAAAAAAAPPPPQEDDATAQLQNLANLHAQGVLTDEEFAASKAKKILGI